MTTILLDAAIEAVARRHLRMGRASEAATLA
jgi:hypothetical protein